MESRSNDLLIAIRQGYGKPIVEGDFQILIQVLKTLMNGTKPAKETNNWRLAAGLENTTANLIHIPTLILLRVGQKANQLAAYSQGSDLGCRMENH